MVLSNAERQKLFRQRRDAAAKGANLGEQARIAIDAALAVAWDVYDRNPNMGGPADYCADLEAFRVWLAGGVSEGPAAEARGWIASSLIRRS